jgi:hypothetical protein
MSAVIYARVSPAIKAAVDALAVELGITMGACVGELLARGLAMRNPDEPLSISARMSRLLDERRSESNE